MTETKQVMRWARERRWSSLVRTEMTDLIKRIHRAIEMCPTIPMEMSFESIVNVRGTNISCRLSVTKLKEENMADRTDVMDLGNAPKYDVAGMPAEIERVQRQRLEEAGKPSEGEQKPLLVALSAETERIANRADETARRVEVFRQCAVGDLPEEVRQPTTESQAAYGVIDFSLKRINTALDLIWADIGRL